MKFFWWIKERQKVFENYFKKYTEWFGAIVPEVQHFIDNDIQNMTTIYWVIVFEDFDMYARLFKTKRIRDEWINESEPSSYRFFEYKIEDEYAGLDLGFGQSLS